MGDTLSSTVQGGLGSENKTAHVSEANYIDRAKELFEQGQTFLAQDHAAKGLVKYPKSIKLRQLTALGLSMTGAVEEAKNIVAPLLSQNKETIIGAPGDVSWQVDSDTLEVFARIFMEIWKVSTQKEDLSHSLDLYLASFKKLHLTRTGILTAIIARLLDDQDLAREMAEKVIELSYQDITKEEGKKSHSKQKAAYRQLADRGIALILLGKMEEAFSTLEQAKAIAGTRYSLTVSARQQLVLLKNHMEVPESFLSLLKSPPLVVFNGHSIAQSENPQDSFKPYLEEQVKAAIEEALDKMGALIGYSSASCGADLLFIEAMKKRGGEVNIVLPFAEEDFIQDRVAYAGDEWVRRFKSALEGAVSVNYATEERFLGHEMLFRFGNAVQHGLAEMRGKFLDSEPHLLVVWDMKDGSLVGGAADMIDHWSDIATLHIIDLDDLAANVTPSSLLSAASSSVNPYEAYKTGPQRTIKTMLFSDLHGYSKLQDEDIPGYIRFLAEVDLSLKEKAMQRGFSLPESMNTWGDALFSVMGEATSMAYYALSYCDCIREVSEVLTSTNEFPKLPHALAARISLHAGPVFQSSDPFLKKGNYFGSHINRAARLEPVTVVGHVYATQQFVALLNVEKSLQKVEAERLGKVYVDPFVEEYVGAVSLAKNYGQQIVYHLRWA